VDDLVINLSGGDAKDAYYIEATMNKSTAIFSYTLEHPS